MPETAGQQLVEDSFSRMAERRMAEIVTQGDGLGKVFIELQGFGNGAGDLGYFQGVGQAGPVVVTAGREKNLGFMFQPPE